MADLADLGCCNCFSFLRKRSSVPSRAPRESDGMLSKDLLQRQSTEDDVDEDVDGSFYTGDNPDMSFYNGGDLDGSFYNRDDDPGTSFYDRDGNEYPDGGDNWRQRKTSEELIRLRIEKGQICRGILVRETSKLIRSEDENGTKMINQYIHMGKIGSGSYGKVVLYKSTKDGNLYAVKVFNKAHLEKIHVVRTETAMTDVRREVSIMKILEHPNIVNLVEVIDDPDIDKFYMVLEYVEGKMVCDNGIEEATARSYMRDIISGLMYLHSHNIIHGDIKPDNLLVTSTGNVKIGDFSVSQVFEGNDDMIWRSPGTPVFTAPECCQGSLYRGRPSDTWALGVTLYCMISGRYPFLGDTLQGTYDKILYDAVQTPDNINPHLADLLQRLLCKDPEDRITLQEVAEHPWVVGNLGPITECDCRCGFPRTNKIDFQEEVQ